MPYCPSCGFEVSHDDIRCSKCGVKLENSGDKIKIPKIKIPVIGSHDNKHHNIEFALSAISFIRLLLVFSPLYIQGYYFSYNGYYYNDFSFLTITLLVAFIGSITVRYLAKIGAIILLITILLLFLTGVENILLCIILYAIVAIIAMFRK